MIAPTNAPRNKDGEKTPPNIPKPIHIDVKNIFKNNIIIKIENILGEVIMLDIVFTPKPKTSGKNIPTIPQKKAGI